MAGPTRSEVRTHNDAINSLAPPRGGGKRGCGGRSNLPQNQGMRRSAAAWILVVLSSILGGCARTRLGSLTPGSPGGPGADAVAIVDGQSRHLTACRSGAHESFHGVD